MIDRRRAGGGDGDVEPCLDTLLREDLARIDARLSRLTTHRRALSTLAATGRAPEASATAEQDPGLLLTG